MKDNCPVLMQSEEKAAPWNQREPTPVEVACTVCYCMSKYMPVQVMNYETSEDVRGSLYDEGTEYFFDGTNFIEEYKNDANAIGIPTLLRELQKLCKEKILKLLDEQKLTHSEADSKQIRKEILHYNNLMVASKDWVVDDLDVVKED